MKNYCYSQITPLTSRASMELLGHIVLFTDIQLISPGDGQIEFIFMKDFSFPSSVEAGVDTYISDDKNTLVIDSLSKPYPVAGDFAVVPVGDFVEGELKDLIAISDQNGVAAYIGRMMSGQTDFYTPFGSSDAVAYFDQNKVFQTIQKVGKSSIIKSEAVGASIPQYNPVFGRKVGAKKYL